MTPLLRTPVRSRVEMTHIILPQFTNAMGHLFGGQLVSWMDICCAVAAQRHAARPVVTASIDAVHFIVPVKEGHTLVLKGQVNAVFRTSVECGVSAWTEDLVSGERNRAAKAYLTFVALDEGSHPMTVPAIHLETEEDRRRAAQAEERRAQRLAMRRAVEPRRSM